MDRLGNAASLRAGPGVLENPCRRNESPERRDEGVPEHPGEGAELGIAAGNSGEQPRPRRKIKGTLPALGPPFALGAVLGTPRVEEPLPLLLGRAGSAPPSSPPPPLLPSRDAASPALQIQLVMAGLIDCRFPRNRA